MGKVDKKDTGKFVNTVTGPVAADKLGFTLFLSDEDRKKALSQHWRIEPRKPRWKNKNNGRNRN